jgi:arylsulfatase A-like enzyme
MSRSKRKSIQERQKTRAAQKKEATLRRERRRRASRVAAIVALIVLIVAVAGVVLWQRARRGEPGLPPTLAAGAARGFNLLVVTLDTTRADHLGCYGRDGAETPALDRLAREGVRFDDAVTNAPVTLPAHASIFTGLYPPNHGVRRNGEYVLGLDQKTLAEDLARAGYDTAAFVGAFVLDARCGLAQGFDVYDDFVNPPTSLSLSHSYDERNAAQVTESALRWLHSRNAERPFFAWVHYFDPHQPFQAPEPFRSRFGERQYDAEIAYVDSQVTRLVDALAALGVDDRTLVVVVGDHGEGLGEHGESSHDFFVYESVMRVPLIVWAPGAFEGPFVVDDVVVSVTDLYPTVLDLLGLEVPPTSDGLSLVRGLPGPDRAVYMESLAPYLDYGWSPLFALRRHRDKYIRAPDPEYYDLLADPDEADNLGSEAGLRDDLEAMLAGWPTIEEVSADAVVDSATRARLEALGYVGSMTAGPRDTSLDPKEMIDVFNRYDAARAMARDGRWQQAVGELEAVAAISPGNRLVLAELARIYSMTGNLPAAERVLRRNIALGPTPQASQRPAEVEELANRALAMDSRHGMAYIVLGDLAGMQQRFEDARSLYNQAKEVDPHRQGLAHDQRMKALESRLRAAEAAKSR